MQRLLRALKRHLGIWGKLVILTSHLQRGLPPTQRTLKEDPLNDVGFGPTRKEPHLCFQWNREKSNF